MARCIRNGIILCTFLLGYAAAGQAAISLTVSLSSLPADSSTGAVLTTQADAPGGSVLLELYHDYNQNGTVDSDEWALESQFVTDNKTGSAAPGTQMFGYDTASSDTNISVAFYPPGAVGGLLPEGSFLFRVVNAANEAAVYPVTVTPPVVSTSLSVSGTVFLQGTTTPVPDVLVACLDKTTEMPLSAAYTGSDGSYQMPLASAADCLLVAEKKGYIGSSATVQVTSAPVTGADLYLPQGDATVAGSITEYGTNSPVPGVEVEAWNATDDLMGDAFAGLSGQFSLDLLTGEDWQIYAEAPGYFAPFADLGSGNYQNMPYSMTVQAGQNPLDIVMLKETAQVAGTVLDETGSQPVEGVLLFVNRINTSDPVLSMAGNGRYSDVTGNVTVGIADGDWQVGLCMNCHAHPVRINGQIKELVPPATQSLLNVQAGETRTVTLQTYYADGAIEGTVFMADGTTPAPAGVRVTASCDTPLNGTAQTAVPGPIVTSTETDSSGHYRLPVLGGSWSVEAFSMELDKQSDSRSVTVVTDGDEVIATGETFGGIDLVLDATSTPPPPTPTTGPYSIEYFNVVTMTKDGGDPNTFFQFNILDSDNYNFATVANVVQSVTVTYPDNSKVSYTPKIVRWNLVELQSTDTDRNGAIDVTGGEYQTRANLGWRYQILSQISPHAAGTYHLEVTCTNGQVLVKDTTVGAGMDATGWPPVTGLTAAFTPAGLLQLAWNLPSTPYPADSSIEIRLDAYGADGQPANIRFRVNNLPPTLTGYTSFKWESDAVRLLSPYISVQVRVNSAAGENVAKTVWQEYAVVDGGLTPTVIPTPLSGDVNGDGKIGLAEAIRALGVASGLVSP